MKYPTIWTSIFLGGVFGLLPFCVALPVDVSSERSNITEASWEIHVFLVLVSLAVLVTILSMCACGDKPTTVSDPVPPDVDPSCQPLQQASSVGGDSQSVGAHSPPLPTTPNGPPYQNVQGNGSVPSPPSPSVDGREGANSPMVRASTIERQLPAIPAKMRDSVGGRASSSVDYDDDYDTIKNGKEGDYDATYSSVKDKEGVANPSVPEDDYAAVDMGRRSTTGADTRVPVTAPVSPQPVSPVKMPPERMAPRAEPEPDISDAEYAVVDMRTTNAAPSTSKGSTDPYESLKGEEGAVGGAKPKKKNHGYAKIDDVRGDNPVASGGANDGHTSPERGEQRSSPVRSPRTPPQTSPSHSAGSPSHHRRSLPEIDDSALGAVGGDPPPPDVQAGQQPEVVEGLTNDGTKKKEPRYSQVSARESLARVRAREQEVAQGAPAPQLYQAVDEESAMGGDDHSDLYESVDYQSVDGNQERPTSSTRSSSNQMPPRRARVYEEINDRDANGQAEGGDASIEPYAVVEPLGRRKTAPSRIASRTDSSGSEVSELYAKVDKPSKISRGISADTGTKQEQDFAGLYAKVQKKKKHPPPAKVESFDENAAKLKDEDSSMNGDSTYAEVTKPEAETNNIDRTSQKRSDEQESVPGRESQDFDDSYQSIDDIRANQRIDRRAREVGMVHIDAVKTGPIVWEKPEHTYASVDREPEPGQAATTNGHDAQPQQVNHEYEAVDKKAAKKAAKQKKKAKNKEAKEAKNSGRTSPTKLDKKKLKVLADRSVKETDL